MCRITTDECPFCGSTMTYCLTHTPGHEVVEALDEHLAEHVEEMTMEKYHPQTVIDVYVTPKDLDDFHLEDDQDYLFHIHAKRTRPVNIHGGRQVIRVVEDFALDPRD
jgi:hypothetical protein